MSNVSIYPVPLKPCPFCGETDEMRIRLQTPICNDGMVRDAYLRCSACGAHGPYLTINKTADTVGKIAVLPIVEKWNGRRDLLIEGILRARGDQP